MSNNLEIKISLTAEDLEMIKNGAIVTLPLGKLADQLPIMISISKKQE